MLATASRQLAKQAGPCQEGVAVLARGLAGSAPSLREEAPQEGTVDFGELFEQHEGRAGWQWPGPMLSGGAACRLPPAAHCLPLHCLLATSSPQGSKTFPGRRSRRWWDRCLAAWHPPTIS